jgi:hypothetical protein
MVVMITRQKRRNWALFGSLIAFVALVYAVTMVRIGQGLTG